MFRATFRRSIVLFALVVLLTGNTGFTKLSPKITEPLTASIYDQLDLHKLGLRREVFDKAMSGFSRLKKKVQIERTDVISIADMSQSANEKRLYVVDLENKKVLYNTFVSHGRNSGEEYAVKFGNKPQSYRSSLGFYITGDSYYGQHGLAMRLQGLEKGINHRAYDRAIVVHGADYVSKSFIEKFGRLGRSQGCPAVPHELCEPIVNCIKSGSCFFVFYPDSGYFRKSDFFKD